MQEYRHITTVVRNRGVGTGLPFFSIRPETTRIEGPAHTEVRHLRSFLLHFNVPREKPTPSQLHLHARHLGLKEFAVSIASRECLGRVNG